MEWGWGRGQTESREIRKGPEEPNNILKYLVYTYFEVYENETTIMPSLHRTV